ncbi:MAG: GNAT family N-acetyltransferase [Streptosporangiaceae bacterium]
MPTGGVHGQGASWATSGPTRAVAARQAGTGSLVGGFELRVQPDGSAQVSYWTSARQRRSGHAPRALTLLLRYTRSIGVTRVEAEIAIGNMASRRIADKSGFHLVGTFPRRRWFPHDAVYRARLSGG